MAMIADERPSKTKGFGLGDDITLAFNEIIPVLIIGEYPAALDSTNDNTMQASGCIDASLVVAANLYGTLCSVIKL